jgi:glycosyltransferase involved in cell wall biosynthesis
VRILVDAMCAEFGGIRTYVEHLLRSWPDRYPDDELHVLVARGSDLPTDARLHRHEAAIPSVPVLGRPWAQTRHLNRLARQLSPDAVLATLPSTTLQRLPCPTAVVVYDLRHELRPEQFSLKTRALRAVSYRRGYAIADGFVSISQRSLDDLHRQHPRIADVPAVVAHLGADHVDDWPAAEKRTTAVAFGHHSNKNLELVLSGWQCLAEEGRAPAPLTILGLGAPVREELSRRLPALGLAGEVTLAPFMPDAEFQAQFASARVIVFPSDFEGFGLPVAEAMRLGIPVVIGPERATQEVAGGHAVVMGSWTSAALAAAVREALSLSPDAVAAAREFAARYTWAATVDETRGLLSSLVDARVAAGRN